ncbi:hypothetical protein BOTBODRAFT_183975 [Botryobasidium botryosum FD-172 SS1]|uniref:RRM domain-containing protein n=1 Tax=Botryobasidium botryosum (strain FD-172 SS1) TaxID=930990 RepID=A0A067MZ28_BOTB1|nr:hypothetical protein BOTBODRAFT_183975 [Botryobasidium botryosum FD-172 SS1]
MSPMRRALLAPTRSLSTAASTTPTSSAATLLARNPKSRTILVRSQTGSRFPSSAYIFAIVRTLEKKYGEVEHFKFPRDPNTSLPTPFGFVTFKNWEDVKEIPETDVDLPIVTIPHPKHFTDRFDAANKSDLQPKPEVPNTGGDGLFHLRGLLARAEPSLVRENDLELAPQDKGGPERFTVQLKRTPKETTYTPNFSRPHWQSLASSIPLVRPMLSFSGHAPVPGPLINALHDAWRERATSLKIPIPKATSKETTVTGDAAHPSSASLDAGTPPAELKAGEESDPVVPAETLASAPSQPEPTPEPTPSEAAPPPETEAQPPQPQRAHQPTSARDAHQAKLERIRLTAKSAGFLAGIKHTPKEKKEQVVVEPPVEEIKPVVKAEEPAKVEEVEPEERPGWKDRWSLFQFKR